MTTSTSPGRTSASKVAKFLLEKQRPQEAVDVLCAWAVQGPNDPEGQALLAEALRVDPQSKVAQMAFEKMEGLKGEHAPLEAAVARFGRDEIQKLEREIHQPSFRRAQVGFNNNVKYHERVFHVQTEDSGLDKPHIITHLFADGGRVIKSHKRSYAAEVNRADVARYVRALMKAQHMEMLFALREGRFDAIIDGTQRAGGVEVLVEPPSVDVKRMTGKRSDAPPPVPPVDAVTLAMPKTEDGVVRFRLNVRRSLTGGPDSYKPRGDEVVLGSKGAVALPGEVFCHPREAVIRFRDGRLFAEDLEGGNGIFLRIHNSVELAFGDEFVVGDQLIRVLGNPPPDDMPEVGPTYFYSSPKWPSAFRVVQIFQGGALGACVLARGTTLQVGSSEGDFVFPNDPLVSAQHCLIEEQAGAVVLTDLSSRTGVFVRLQGEVELKNGDEILVGRTRLVVVFPYAERG